MRNRTNYFVLNFSLLMFLGCSNSSQPNETILEEKKKDIEVSKIYLDEQACSSKKNFLNEEDQIKWAKSFVNKELEINNIDQLSTLNCFRHDSSIKKLISSFGWEDIDTILAAFDKAIDDNKESLNAVNSIKQLKFKWSSLISDDLYLFCDPVNLNTGKGLIEVNKPLSSEEIIAKRSEWIDKKERERDSFFKQAVAPLKELKQKIEEKNINDLNLEEEAKKFLPVLGYAFQNSYASLDDVRTVTYSIQNLDSYSSIDDVIKKYKHVVNLIDVGVFTKGPLSSQIGIVRIHRNIRFNVLNTLYDDLISTDFEGKYIDVNQSEFEFYNKYSRSCVGETAQEAQQLIDL